MDHTIKDAIILAGGLGTRLRSEIGEFPKVLAPVNGKPFLTYVLDYLKKNGIETAVLSVGYKAELIHEQFGDDYQGMKLIYAVEKEPLGTGGGMKLALEKNKAEMFFVLNGDTFFDIDLKQLETFHLLNKSTCTLALKKMKNVDRYGNVELDENGKIKAFSEKKFREEAVINGGIYCINRGILIHYPVNTPFSFETNYLENKPQAKNIFGKIFDNYFMDIGVPEDYQQFQKDHTR
ncbi:MAG: nucleotidyltransferase family protein [Crocinitomicaceae bacterium]|nr:nucleotidyltransferase family protein [Crocinitomicaceae bacterium]